MLRFRLMVNEVRVGRLKHQKEKRSMDHFAGLDVSVKETSVCIVDDTGKIVGEVMIASEPEALLAVLRNAGYHSKRIGLEAGPLSQWLFSALREAGLPVICVEIRHLRAVPQAQINKTDSNHACGIAQMMRVGLYRPVHVKTLRSQKLRMTDPPQLLQSISHRYRERFAWHITAYSVVSAETKCDRANDNGDHPPLPSCAALAEKLSHPAQTPLLRSRCRVRLQQDPRSN